MHFEKPPPPAPAQATSRLAEILVAGAVLIGLALLILPLLYKAQYDQLLSEQHAQRAR